jgi:alpha-L-arabinofuranosidase
MKRLFQLSPIVAAAIIAAGTVTVMTRGAVDRPTQTLEVGVGQPGAPIPSTLYGIFFEDINFAADGGLYPERIKNRSFEFPEPLMGWQKAIASGGSFEIRTDDPVDQRNPHYLRITTDEAAHPFGVRNDGFRGVGVQQGQHYTISVVARRRTGTAGALRFDLQDTSGSTSSGTATVDLKGSTWASYSVPFVPTRTEARGRLAVYVDGPGTIDVDVVSLYPDDTFNHRKNGLRADLGQLLKDMHPGFIRFPGGCIVEGRYLDGRYRWKETIGAVSDRRLIVNRWNNEFVDKPAPDYYQSFGLGFYEYFLLAEDLGAEPLPILNCGMACQFNSSELAPMDQLEPYIQDALDLIEFANGPATSTWGKKRAELGHPAPFNMKLLGVGNEQWGPQYIERFAVFQKRLKAAHPDVRLVSSADPFTERENFKTQWAKLRELDADLVDEHFYRPPAWFFQNATRYDSYPRTGPHIFAGEYAAHTKPVGSGESRNVWEAALAEAAWMTGLERNADLVDMSSYAPLFGHVDAWQWSPNLIWFDNLRSFGTPNYYVQQLFGANRGTRLLPVKSGGAILTGQHDLYATASLDESSGEVIVKIVNSADAETPVHVTLAGVKDGTANTIVLAAEPMAENSLNAPTAIAPVEQPATVSGSAIDRVLPKRSLTVVRVKKG